MQEAQHYAMKSDVYIIITITGLLFLFNSENPISTTMSIIVAITGMITYSILVYKEMKHQEAIQQKIDTIKEKHGNWK